MTRYVTAILALSMTAALGCTGDVETTDDSIKMEAEVPKVETGPGKVDLDPRTDSDVDVDTPAPGDT